MMVAVNINANFTRIITLCTFILCSYTMSVASASAMELPGINDLRISDMGPNGDTSYGATEAATVYNATNREYLIVWEGDDNSGGVVDNELEIYGQFISDEGYEIEANDFRISIQGGSGDSAFDAVDPAVAWNSTDNEYLVVWSGDRIQGEDEIYGQRLNANGSLIGSSFRISDMGTDGNTSFDAVYPQIAYNASNNEYLVVWEADNDVNGEQEIWGQRLNASGAEIGANDFKISNQGPLEDTSYDAVLPALVWNTVNNEYLVVWSGDRISGEDEIYGQRLSNTGGEIGGDFRISQQGPDGDTGFDAVQARITHNASNDQYLVVWSGDRVSGEEEIYGQRLSNTGGEIGGDFLISTHLPNNTSIDAVWPDVVWGSIDNEYLVVWHGDTSTAGEEEIYIQNMNSNAYLVGVNTRISDMGPDNSTTYLAQKPTIAFNAYYNEYLAAWEADENIAPLVDNEKEIFMQLLGDSIPIDTDGDGLRNSVDPDDDNDGFTDAAEHIADTDALDDSSFLKILSISHGDGSMITFSSSANRVYNLKSTTNLVLGAWSTLITNAPGTLSFTSLTDSNAAPSKYYRIEVKIPYP